MHRSSILPLTHYLTSIRQGFLLRFEQVTFSIDVQAILVVTPQITVQKEPIYAHQAMDILTNALITPQKRRP